MSGQMGVQHYLAQSHFRRFTSGRQGDGMFVIYDKTTRLYRDGLPRKIKGGRFERKPPRDLAIYVTLHPQAVERRMERVESAMTQEWNRVKSETAVFGPDAIPAILRYMALTAMRHPESLRGWGLDIRVQQGIVFGQESMRELASRHDILSVVEGVLQGFPSWKVHTLDPDSDDEYVLSDSPALVGLGRMDGKVWEKSIAEMAMSKKQLLIGFWDEAAIQPLTFDADSTNGMIFCKAEREVYSHRLLDQQQVREWAAMEPLVRRVMARTALQIGTG
jgi:hypothetical protein